MSDGGSGYSGSAWRNGGSANFQPHAFDPYLQPELFRGVLTRRVFAFLIDLIVIAVPVILGYLFIALFGLITLGLGWALFCAADDKLAVAVESRKLLEKAVYKSQQPEIAHFYLGRVERILGRDKEALRHFHAVLDVQPNHRDASAEVRVIEARLKRLGIAN